MLFLVPLTALPAGAVVLAGTAWDQPLLTWAGIPAGLLSGAFFAWLLGGIAYRRLRAHGPEMLALMRSGTAPAKSAGVGGMQLPPMPRSMAILVYVCWSLFWLPLFPQGLVPLVVKLIGTPIRSWFLALYLPSIWQWPVIIGMIALGLAMVATAYRIQRRYERAQTA
jgi:ABC-2 type transport system permease protein